MKDSRMELSKLLLVLALGVLCAFGTVAFMVYHYGPSGTYRVKNTLLAPEVLHKLWFNDTNLKTGGNTRFVFKDIEVVIPGNTQPIFVSIDTYRKIYQLISSDNSILEPDEKLVQQFSKRPLLQLKIIVKTESSADWQSLTKVFQVVEVLSEGDTYRIDLHEENPEKQWAYFHQTDIYDKMIKILQKETFRQ